MKSWWLLTDSNILETFMDLNKREKDSTNSHPNIFTLSYLQSVERNLFDSKFTCLTISANMLIIFRHKQSVTKYELAIYHCCLKIRGLKSWHKIDNYNCIKLVHKHNKNKGQHQNPNKKMWLNSQIHSNGYQGAKWMNLYLPNYLPQ